MVLSLTGCSGPLSTLEPSGPHAQGVAWLWWGMFWFATIVLIGMTWLWWRAMRRDGTNTAPEDLQKKQNSWVLWGGIALPTGAITLLLAFGIPIGHRMLPLDTDGVMTIEIEARQWYWQVYYPDLDITLIDEIHIPVDTPVNFQISSQDVIHSFWVPRLGGKVDAIPGRTNQLRLQASETGSFQGQCAEYCGVAHTYMDFIVHAHSAEDYAAWQEQATDEPRIIDNSREQSE
ncbi:MAG: cytochrome c oxidase subunit II [Idiomarina sp.]|nr:cytochrome c oxidase subunit II [Idiomarina sp.]